MPKEMLDRRPVELHAAALIAAANIYATKTGETPRDTISLLGSRSRAGDPTPAKLIAEFAKELLNAYSPLPPLPELGSVA
jgi:hypothetical protein